MKKSVMILTLALIFVASVMFMQAQSTALLAQDHDVISIYGSGMFTTFADDYLQMPEEETREMERELGQDFDLDVDSGFGGEAGLELQPIPGLGFGAGYGLILAGADDTASMYEEGAEINIEATNNDMMIHSMRGHLGIDLMDLVGADVPINLTARAGAGYYFGDKESSVNISGQEGGQSVEIELQELVDFEGEPGFHFGGGMGINLTDTFEIFAEGNYRLLEFEEAKVSGHLRTYEDGRVVEEEIIEEQHMHLSEIPEIDESLDLSGFELMGGISLNF